jgi:hypothetical protein
VRDAAKANPKAAQAPGKEPKPKLQIVKLEERIAPSVGGQHNETLVRESAKPKVQQNGKGERKSKLAIVKLEERITPGLNSNNHNETLVREPAKVERKAPEVTREFRKPKLQIVKLEERITPSAGGQHNETLVRDRG